MSPQLSAYRQKCPFAIQWRKVLLRLSLGRIAFRLFWASTSLTARQSVGPCPDSRPRQDEEPRLARSSAWPNEALSCAVP